MLLEIAKYFANFYSGFNVFQYLTLRVVLSTLTSLVVALLIGPVMIRKLTQYRVGQSVRTDGPQTHLGKSGTPTMGGVLILVAIAIGTLLWVDLGNRYVWLVLVVTLLFGVIGWVDDYRKLVLRNSKGLSARAKFFWQSVIAIVAVSWIAFMVKSPAQTELIV